MLPRGARGLKARGPAVCAYLGLALLVGGLAWRGWSNRAWPGATADEALLSVAAAGLLLGTWVARRVSAPQAAGASDAAGAAGTSSEGVAGEVMAVDEAAVAYGLGLLLTAVLILGATALAWVAAPPATAQADSWLFGLRSGLASLGLGCWPFVFAGNLAALRQGRRKANVPQTAPQTASNVLRAGYPWLTFAVLAGGAWEMAATAMPWRGVPADLWLAVAWLLGGAYLMLASARPAKSLSAWPPAALSFAGLAAALLAAGLAGSLFW